MSRPRQQSIRTGDRVRSYEFPGVSDRDYVSGTVTGQCVLAGLPRFIIESLSITVHGQEEPCRRVFYAPVACVVSEEEAEDLHRVA